MLSRKRVGMDCIFRVEFWSFETHPHPSLPLEGEGALSTIE
jgi:hypothetical protein